MRKTLTLLLLGLAALACLSACSEIGAGHDYHHEIPQLQDSYYDLSTILAGDHLRIEVAGDIDSKQELIVPDDGIVDIAHVGPLLVEGKSRSIVRQEITSQLVKTGFYTEPQVLVNIEIRENPPVISVLGAVNKAGIIRYRKDMDVYMALASAGGMRSSEGYAYPVIVIRNALIQPQIFRFDIEDAVDHSRTVPRLVPGDVVIAQSSLVEDLARYFEMAHDASVAMVNTKTLVED